MDTDQVVETIEPSGLLFGDLYEWNKCSVPRYQITSLLISDDLDFNQTDLSIICDMSPLRQLFLHNLNQLDSLPPAIAKLNQLKVLSITHCDRLLELPLAVRFLRNLETLRLDCSNLTELPAFLSLIPSLNLLLLRKTIAICGQCKQHLKKSTRVIILPQPYDVTSIRKTMTSLAILAADRYISYFNGLSFYQTVPWRCLWPSLESAMGLQMNRCLICLANCSPNQKISINFTRFCRCKCVHLMGFLCSDSCRAQLCVDFHSIFENAEIYTSSDQQTMVNHSHVAHPLTSEILRRRVKKVLSWWSLCVPRYHKKSYTVNAY